MVEATPKRSTNYTILLIILIFKSYPIHPSDMGRDMEGQGFPQVISDVTLQRPLMSQQDSHRTPYRSGPQGKQAGRTRIHIKHGVGAEGGLVWWGRVLWGRHVRVLECSVGRGRLTKAKSPADAIVGQPQGCEAGSKPSRVILKARHPAT